METPYIQLLDDDNHRLNRDHPVERGIADPSQPQRVMQQIRLNEKYRYVAELRFEVEQVRNQINSVIL
jgi:hypothetical protein